MFVNAAVREIRELNQNKKEKKNNYEIDYCQFKTFPGHIFIPFEHMYSFNLLEVLHTTN